MVLPDGNWEDPLGLRLLRVQQKILGVEASPTYVRLPIVSQKDKDKERVENT
ncbi:hypothetical protein GCM10025794_32280 [Massilia kyonggiensis]